MIPGQLTLLMQHPNYVKQESVNGGVQLLYDCANGYGASVVQHDFSYGGKKGLFELAVLMDGYICYDTPITDGVLGWLKVSDVLEVLDKIKELN